jgi:6-phosphogluconolactonase
MTELKILLDYESLSQAAAASFIQIAAESIDRQGRFSAALSGGSTPLRLYNLLSTPEMNRVINWSKTHIFWCDERCVPPDHPDSNYHMAKQAFLDHVQLPERNLHRIFGELGLEEATDRYEGEIYSFFNSKEDTNVSHTFDLVLLGMGVDGHIASLFPGSPALEIHDRWVAGVKHHQPPDPQVNRVSLTLEAINSANLVMFLVSGEHKAQALANVMHPDPNQPLLPAARVAPQPGKLVWLVDQAAATLL